MATHYNECAESMNPRPADVQWMIPLSQQALVLLMLASENGVTVA